MSARGDEPACGFPAFTTKVGGQTLVTIGADGLTVREWLTGQALAGLCANGHPMLPYEAAQLAAKMADATLAALKAGVDSEAPARYSTLPESTSASPRDSRCANAACRHLFTQHEDGCDVCHCEGFARESTSASPDPVREALVEALEMALAHCVANWDQPSAQFYICHTYERGEMPPWVKRARAALALAESRP